MPPAVSIPDEKPSVILASLVMLGADVVAYGAFLFHALRVRHRLDRIADGLIPAHIPPAADLFLSLPVPVFVAFIMLLIVGLLMKEIACERKSLALKLNIAAFLAAIGLFAAFLVVVQKNLMETRLP